MAGILIDTGGATDVGTARATVTRLTGVVAVLDRAGLTGTWMTAEDDAAEALGTGWLTGVGDDELQPTRRAAAAAVTSTAAGPRRADNNTFNS